MKKIKFLLANVLVGVTVYALAAPAEVAMPGAAETSTANIDKTAVIAPSTTAPAAEAPPSPAPKPAAPRPGINELRGKLLSISYDPRTLRLIVDGGFNVEFTYDKQTSLLSGGDKVSFDDLTYNDELIIRYSGKELYAVEIERVSKAARVE